MPSTRGSRSIFDQLSDNVVRNRFVKLLSKHFIEFHKKDRVVFIFSLFLVTWYRSEDYFLGTIEKNKTGNR
jgi:hypothetical protein